MGDYSIPVCDSCESSSTCAGCQDSCTSSEGSSCYTSCESSCQTGCETGCQGYCQTSCQSKSETNRRPDNPGSLNVPGEVIEGRSIAVSWSKAYDADNDTLTYMLYRSVDNGVYNHVYTGRNLNYNDTCPKGIKTVRYRLDVSDGYITSSNYVYSNIIKVLPENRPPIISGSDLNLGSKQEDFEVSYIVTEADAGDSVTVTEQIDDVMLKQNTPITLGVARTIKISIDDYNLGVHKIRIIAKDKAGLTATRTYTFNKVNSAPVISGSDQDLGNKNSAFTLVYTVKDPNGDKVNVFEKINGKTIKNITNIGTGEQQITVTSEMLTQYEINAVNTIEIEARDNNNAVSYRRFTFRRSNFAPVISDTDRDIGEMDKSISYDYSATDQEKDPIKLKVFLDNKLVVPEFQATDNKTYNFKIDGFEFLKIPFGKHTIKIVAMDSNGLSSQRVLSFTRVAKRLVMQLKEPRNTDVAAKKVLVIPGWYVAPGAKAKVEVCNNAYDDNPTWEDATIVTNDGRAFHFQNASKTSYKWGVNIRLTIEKGTSTAYSYITTIGGSVE